MAWDIGGAGAASSPDAHDPRGRDGWGAPSKPSKSASKSASKPASTPSESSHPADSKNGLDQLADRIASNKSSKSASKPSSEASSSSPSPSPSSSAPDTHGSGPSEAEQDRERARARTGQAAQAKPAAAPAAAAAVPPGQEENGLDQLARERAAPSPVPAPVPAPAPLTGQAGLEALGRAARERFERRAAADTAADTAPDAFDPRGEAYRGLGAAARQSLDRETVTRARTAAGLPTPGTPNAPAAPGGFGGPGGRGTTVADLVAEMRGRDTADAVAGVGQLARDVFGDPAKMRELMGVLADGLARARTGQPPAPPGTGPGRLAGLDDRIGGVGDAGAQIARDYLEDIRGLPSDVADYGALVLERSRLGIADLTGTITPEEAARLAEIDRQTLDRAVAVRDEVLGAPAAVAEWFEATREAWQENERVKDAHARGEATDEATRAATERAAMLASAAPLALGGVARRMLDILRGPADGRGGGIAGLPRERPRLEDGNRKEGWQHIEERHMDPGSTGDQFAPGTTRVQVTAAAEEIVEKGVRISNDPSGRLQAYERRMDVNGLRANYRVVVDSQDANRIITMFPIMGGN